MKDERDPHYYSHTRVDLIQLIPTGTTKILEVGCGAGMTGKTLRESAAALLNSWSGNISSWRGKDRKEWDGSSVLPRKPRQEVRLIAFDRPCGFRFAVKRGMERPL